jgi:hypothetical protein
MARNSKGWEVRQQSIIVSFIATLCFGLAGCASVTYTMPTPIEDQPDFSVTVPRDVDATWTAVTKLLARPKYRVTRSNKEQGIIAFTVVDGPFANARYSYKDYIDCGHFDGTPTGRAIKFNGPYIDFLMSVHSARVTVLNTVLIDASVPLETNVSVRSEYDIRIPKRPEYSFSFGSGGHARVQTPAIGGSDPFRICQPTHYLERTFLEHVERVVALTESPELRQVVAPLPAPSYSQPSTRPAWVSVNALNSRTCPSTACGVVGVYRLRDEVTVYETKAGWSRVSEYSDAKCTNGIAPMVTSGDRKCVPSNGISDSRYARWVSSQHLSAAMPPLPASAPRSSGPRRGDRVLGFQMVDECKRIVRNLFPLSSAMCTLSVREGVAVVRRRSQFLWRVRGF